MKKDGKVRLFEVLQRVDPVFNKKVVNEEVLNETTSYSPIHKFVMFGYNYPPDFIEQAWADRPDMAKHFREKFHGYYNKYGSEGVMNAFYVNLDDSNQQILERWIINNYTV
jgi:hypothetical protein